MNPIQYTCVFRGVVLVQVPVVRPAIEVAPAPPPSVVKPAAPAPSRKTLDTVA